MLCSACSDIFSDGSLQPWIDKELAAQKRNGGTGSQPLDVKEAWRSHHPVAASLAQAAANGCYVCARIVEKFGDHDAGTMYRMARPFDGGSASTLALLFFHPAPNPFSEDGFSTLKLVREVLINLDLLSAGDEALAISGASLGQTYTGNTQCLALGKFWMSECLAKHDSCNSALASAWYPTRLLYLSGETAYLVETAEHHPIGPYATLSHCWGQHPIDVLTPSNRPDFKAGRPIKELPPTFRQCCEVLLHLGIRYVWIDTFCILQGSSAESQADWNREASLMQDVYSNSYLNIGASGSKDSQGGLFQWRREAANNPIRLQWKPTNQHGIKTFALAAHNRDPLSEFNRHYLFTRAWVVQERVLSSRMLHFGKDQLWWQCRQEVLLCESHPSRERSVTMCPTIQGLRPGALHTDSTNIYEIWYGLLGKYTDCDLTNADQDKLLAIEGVATRIASQTNDEYLRGLFLSQLPRALCWERGFEMNINYEYIDGKSRLQAARAPSYSWASRDGTLFCDEELCRSTPGSMLAAFVMHTPESTFASIQNSKDFPTLICIGKVLPIDWGSMKPTDEPSSIEWRGRIDGQNLRCKFDDAHTRSALLHSTPTFFPIYLGEAGDAEGMEGLMLAQTRNGAFRRVGTGHSYNKGMWASVFNSTKPRMIRLV